MFVELKCKSNFSFLRGASSSQEYVSRAAQLGMGAVGITDINGVYALPGAYEEVRDKAQNVKLICGAEVTLADGHPPLTLISQTRRAYGLLCRILTQVHAGKEKGTGFITWAELIALLDHFPEAARELTCLPDLTPKTNLAILKELFLDNLYLPISRVLDGLDQTRSTQILDLSQKWDLPIVATNDVHYHIPQRRPLQDCLTCIREGVTMDTAGFHLFSNEERYLKSPQQMQQLFKDLPQALLATLEIAEKCIFKMNELKYSYPHEFIPEGHTPASYLRQIVQAGALAIYEGQIPVAAQQQIDHELAFFAKRGDEHYFLTVHDVVRFAQEQNIICQGRGSAANSIVCYVLGITSVDPIQMNLLFDRFMNEGRNEPPDIDIDFEHNRREEIIQYIYQRFGRDRAAMVAAVRTYRSKSSFIELSKAVGIPVGTMSAGELEIRFDELAQDKKHRLAFVKELAQDLKKFPRHMSIHSGGFVLSNDPLIEMVPIEPARMEGRTVIQWDKHDLETLGLMKIDILSIGFLTVLHEATDLAGMNWRKIPDNDSKTYAMIQRAETHGTFQIESRAQMNMLPQTLPRNYYDLVVEVALVRPSPTEGGMVKPYLKGLADSRRGKPFRIGNKKLEHILGRTHGIPIFQEQIMQISIDIAGFTPSEADQLRRSLGLQRSAAGVDVMGQKLYNSLLSQGIDQTFADNLFKYIKGYAHYGFPESHAASYASLAYKSAYMKCHHPAALLVGLINAQPIGFYPIDTLINEAKRCGVRVLPIDPHKSVWSTILESTNTVRMGFSNVSQINQEDVTAMIEARNRKSFESIEDFIFRTSFSKEVLENLSLANVFAVFGLDRRHTFWQSIEFSRLSQNQERQQFSLFDEKIKLDSKNNLFSQMSLLEEISIDYRKTSYSLQGTFMKGLRVEIPSLPPLTSVQIKNFRHGQIVRYAGILTVLQKPPPAKGTVFITLEDEFGSIDTVVRKEVYEEFKSFIRASRFLVIEGRVQRKGLGASVLVSRIENFSELRSKKPLTPGASPRGLGVLR